MFFNIFFYFGALPYVSVISAIFSARRFVNALFGARHLQLPDAVDGVFMRASESSPR